VAGPRVRSPRDSGRDVARGEGNGVTGEDKGEDASSLDQDPQSRRNNGRSRKILRISAESPLFPGKRMPPPRAGLRLRSAGSYCSPTCDPEFAPLVPPFGSRRLIPHRRRSASPWVIFSPCAFSALRRPPLPVRPFTCPTYRRVPTVPRRRREKRGTPSYRSTRFVPQIRRLSWKRLCRQIAGVTDPASLRDR